MLCSSVLTFEFHIWSSQLKIWNHSVSHSACLSVFLSVSLLFCHPVRHSASQSMNMLVSQSIDLLVSQSIDLSVSQSSYRSSNVVFSNLTNLLVSHASGTSVMCGKPKQCYMSGGNALWMVGSSGAVCKINLFAMVWLPVQCSGVHTFDMDM